MSREVTRSPRARADLIEIWTYIAEDNEGAADRLDRFEALLLTLLGSPATGRPRPELGEDIRSFPVGRYILFYRPTPSGIDLVRVLSSYRDVARSEFD